MHTRIVYNSTAPIPFPMPTPPPTLRGGLPRVSHNTYNRICLLGHLLNRQARIEALWIENKKLQNLLKVFSSHNDLVLGLHAVEKKMFLFHK